MAKYTRTQLRGRGIYGKSYKLSAKKFKRLKYKLFKELRPYSVNTYGKVYQYRTWYVTIEKKAIYFSSQDFHAVAGTVPTNRPHFNHTFSIHLED